MNISPLNAYKNVTFRAYKPKHVAGKYQSNDIKKPVSKNKSQVKTNKEQQQFKAKIAAILIALGVTGGAVLKSCSNEEKLTSQETTPSTSYSETYAPEETITETQAPIYKTPIKVEVIKALPIEEREFEEYHTVKAGDRLTDIVIEYAELDEDYPYEKLVPYFDILRADNPTLIKENYDIIRIDGKPLRVDGIMEGNLIKKIITIGGDIDTTGTDETAPVDPVDPIDPVKETTDITINGVTFKFDKNTLKDKFGNDYEGFMNGAFAELNVKLNNKIELTIYEGEDSKSNIARKEFYDEDGDLTKIIVYKDGEKAELHEFYLD